MPRFRELKAATLAPAGAQSQTKPGKSGHLHLRRGHNAICRWCKVVTSIKFGAILIGSALGALFAILSIDFFDSNVSQLGCMAACAIFGGIMCAVISAGMPQRTFGKTDVPTTLEAGVPSKAQQIHPPDSPPLVPK